jgi:O-acetylhomoserine (thiol)-lyase
VIHTIVSSYGKETFLIFYIFAKMWYNIIYICMKGIFIMSEYKIGTKAVQGGYTPKNGEPRQIPIIQSTTFKYDTSEDMGKLFDLEASGYFYSRLQNPTNDIVAAKIAELEGGSAAMLTSSGQAATFMSIFNICECGGHIVASSSIYGGTFNLIAVTMAKMGITATFVSPDCTEEELNAAFQDNTKLVFGETIANPALTVLDIEKFAKAAHSHGVPLIIDNTFPTPINCRPIEWGADIVTHSTTKYMDGHGSAVGGVIVDSGKFDWLAHAEKFPGLCTPDESYHGITYAEKFGKEGAFITKCTSQLMRDFGCVQSPQSAFILNLGLESLHVRMPKHVENGQAVAEFLEKHEKVEFVNYSGLPSNKYYELAKKYLPNGGCGVVSFELKGGRKAAEAFMKNLRLAAIETHVADARTCCLNPATSTHRQMTDEQLREAGIPAGLIRISCGLEDKADLIADLAQALDKI